MRPDGKSGVHLPPTGQQQATDRHVAADRGVREPPAIVDSEARRANLKIYAAGAPLDDEEAIMYLCALLPSPNYLCAVVEPPDPAQDPEQESVRFVRCLGRDLWVFWVPDVSSDQAAAITAACEPIRRWSVEAFTAAVGRALGARVTRVQ